MTLDFLDTFSKRKKYWVSNFVKIFPLGAELFHVDEQADEWKNEQAE
jgi:hypothetical protein